MPENLPQFAGNPNELHVAVVIVAAGRGSRMADGGLPKQYRPIGGQAVLTRTLTCFVSHPDIRTVLTVIHPDDQSHFEAAAAPVADGLPWIGGGATRQRSVRLGLEALAGQSPDIVLIHDGARPFASAMLIRRAVAEARLHGGAIPGIAMNDSLARVDCDGNRLDSVDRADLRGVQTPQAFMFAPILAAHRAAAFQGLDDFTDDAAVAAYAGLPMRVFPGEQDNIKLTTTADFRIAATMVNARRSPSLLDIRTGNGFDVHAFGPGDHVVLGGVSIPHDRGLLGHSDADVALHALTDALLGALGDGDIGQHFPPTDPRWKGATSDRFLIDAVGRVRARGGVIGHLDLTIIGEAPKISPHRQEIRSSVASIAGISEDRVSVKATTTERLGFAGRREGLAALATATIRLPDLTEGER